MRSAEVLLCAFCPVAPRGPQLPVARAATVINGHATCARHIPIARHSSEFKVCERAWYDRKIESL